MQQATDAFIYQRNCSVILPDNWQISY